MIGIIDVGGGQRDIYGAGVLDYCMKFGIRFDYCIGVSAGSANMASYLSGQSSRNFRFYTDLRRFSPYGPENPKPMFCTEQVYDYGTSRVVGREQEHIKLELVDSKSSRVMNGIAFGQSSQARYIKTKQAFDIVYSLEENSHKHGEVQLQIEDIKPAL